MRRLATVVVGSLVLLTTLLLLWLILDDQVPTPSNDFAPSPPLLGPDPEPPIASHSCPINLSFDYRLDTSFVPIQHKVECLESTVRWDGATVILVDPRILAADCILDEREGLHREVCLQWAERYFHAVQYTLEQHDHLHFQDAITVREHLKDAEPLPLLAEDGRWGYFHDVLEHDEWHLDLCDTWVSEWDWYVCPREVLWATTLFVDNQRRDYVTEIKYLLDSIADNCPWMALAPGLLLHYSTASDMTAPTFQTLLDFTVKDVDSVPSWILQHPGMSMNFIRTAFFDDTPPQLLEGARHILLIDADIILLHDPLAWFSPRHLRMAQATTISGIKVPLGDHHTWERHGLSHIEQRRIMHHYSGEHTYWFYNGGQVWAPREILKPFLEAEKHHAIMDAETGGDLHYRDMFMMALAYYDLQPPFLELPMSLNLDSALIAEHVSWACKYLTSGPVVAYHYHSLADPHTGEPRVPPHGHCEPLDQLRAHLGHLHVESPTYDQLLRRVHRHFHDHNRKDTPVIHQHTRKAGGGELRRRAYESGLYARGGCELQNACFAPEECMGSNQVILMTSIRDPVSRLESDFNWEGPGGSQAWAQHNWPRRIDGTDDIDHWTTDQWRAWMQWPPGEGLELLAAEIPGVRARGVYLPNYATQLLGSYHQEISDGGFTAPVGYQDTITCPSQDFACQPRMLQRITDKEQTARMLINAKRVLEEEFVLAVPFEEVSSTYFWDYVSEHGGHSIEEAAHVHANTHRYRFPEEIRDEILADNWADQELYEFVQRLHRDRDPCRASGEDAVFLISMHKTATTTWKTMMEDMGYRVARADSHSTIPTAETWKRQLACDRITSTIHTMDAYQDVPWFLFYAEAAEMLPKARFVFIDRPEEEWLKSALHHFTARPPSPWRGYLYGDACNTPIGVALPEECATTLLRVYREHNANVRAYFEKQPDRFLRLDIHNLSWSEAIRHAQFLGYTGTVPDWEHLNKKNP